MIPRLEKKLSGNWSPFEPFISRREIKQISPLCLFLGVSVFFHSPFSCSIKIEKKTPYFRYGPHRESIYAGDSLGRVFLFALPDGGAENVSESVSKCMNGEHTSFGLLEQRKVS